MLIYIGHIVSLAIYASVLITTVIGLSKVGRCGLYGPIKHIIPAFYLSLFAQSFLFLCLQIDWVVSDFNAVVGNSTAYAWLAFDYFNGFALLSFATALNIWLGWRDSKTGSTIYDRRRRRDD